MSDFVHLLNAEFLKSDYVHLHIAELVLFD